MSVPVSNKIRSEGNLRGAFGFVFLVGLPVLLGVVLVATKFVGFTQPGVMDRAQLARQVSAGEGLVTHIYRPLAVIRAPVTDSQPEMLNPPGQPWLQGMVFRAFGVSDRVVVVTNLVLWAATIWLACVAGWRLFGIRAGVLAAWFVLCGVGLISAAVGGQAAPLAALLTLGAVTLLAPASSNPVESRGHWAAVLVAGLLAGGLVLTEYALLPVVLVLALFAGSQRERPGSVLAIFAAGVLLLWLPWLIRNTIVLGAPWRSLWWYELATRTAEYPGDGIFRQVEAGNPVVFALTHPLQILRKVLTGIAQMRSAAFGALDPLVLFLCGVAVFAASQSPRRRNLAVLAFAGALVGIVWTCLFRPEAVVILAWTPVFALGGAAQLDDWLKERVGRWDFDGWTLSLPRSRAMIRRREPPNRVTFGRMRVPAEWARGLTCGAVVVVTSFSLAYYLGVARPAEPYRGSRPDPLEKVVATDALVMTDQPEFAAWYGGRRAVALCWNEADWDELERRLGPVTALHLGPGFWERPARERAEWWAWFATPRGVYRGLTLSPAAPLYGLLRVPQPVEDDAELARLQAEVLIAPQSVEARVRAAVALRARDRLREAAVEFQEALSHDPRSVPSIVGLWELYATRNVGGNVVGLVQRLTQVKPPADAARVLYGDVVVALEGAIGLYPYEPWLLLQAALARARLGQWDAVEPYLRRLDLLAPPTLPVPLIMADLYLNEGMLAQAAEELTKFQQTQPNSAFAYEALGRIRWEQHQYAEALAEFQRASRLRPEWDTPLVKAGFAHLRLGEPAAAVGMFSKALTLVPRSVTAQLGLAEAYEKLNKFPAAMALYEEVLEDDPQSVVALNNLAFLAAETPGMAERAITVAESAVKLHPDNLKLKHTLGWAYYRAGRLAEARAILEAAARIAPDNPTIRAHLAEVHAAVAATPATVSP